MELLTNAETAGLTKEETRLFEHIHNMPRSSMSSFLRKTGSGPIVVDTASIPGLADVDAPLCLILRQTLAHRLSSFRLDRGRPWDIVIVPNPPSQWSGPSGAVPARRTVSVGWIYRSAPVTHQMQRRSRERFRLLIASGGGGSEYFRATASAIVKAVRRSPASSAEIVQVLGPRAPLKHRLRGLDHVVQENPALHSLFSKADVVISTAGYNSVLELAATDVPVLLIPIDRTYDDQQERARIWAPLLGMTHDRRRPASSVKWLTELAGQRRRRRRVPLGPSGAKQAAALIDGIRH